MIVIVDYDVGNVGSVLNMLRKNGAKARISCQHEDFCSADIFMPSVGRFGSGINKFKGTGLVSLSKNQVLTKQKPHLGICPGMRMMTLGNEESNVTGLSWIDAITLRLPEPPRLRIPHIGWNTVHHGAAESQFDRNAAAADGCYFVRATHPVGCHRMTLYNRLRIRSTLGYVRAMKFDICWHTAQPFKAERLNG